MCNALKRLGMTGTTRNTATKTLRLERKHRSCSSSAIAKEGTHYRSAVVQLYAEYLMDFSALAGGRLTVPGRAQRSNGEHDRIYLDYLYRNQHKLEVPDLKLAKTSDSFDREHTVFRGFPNELDSFFIRQRFVANTAETFNRPL